jgi:hypothetical protein
MLTVVERHHSATINYIVPHLGRGLGPVERFPTEAIEYRITPFYLSNHAGIE